MCSVVVFIIWACKRAKRRVNLFLEKKIIQLLLVNQYISDGKQLWAAFFSFFAALVFTVPSTAEFVFFF